MRSHGVGESGKRAKLGYKPGGQKLDWYNYLQRAKYAMLHFNLEREIAQLEESPTEKAMSDTVVDSSPLSLIHISEPTRR